jgi:uncharacterized membrane protein
MAEEDDPRSQEDENAEEPEQDSGDGNGNGNGNGGGSVVDELTNAVREAAMDVLGPAAREATSSAAKYAVKKGPEMMVKNVMPAIQERGGPGELLKQATGGGEGGGGLVGMAGKALSKVTGGGKKGGGATGYGQGRRIMVQQVQYVPVNLKDVYRAWTDTEWPEYMHRVNTLDRQIEDEKARYAIGVKGLWFNKNFTAEVQEQVPFKFIAWRTTQGNIKNTGRVSFIEQGEDLTLMILNLDMAPSGLREKWVRGFRYHKRGIRSDFHRFAAWVQMRTQDELDEIEGWLGTIEGGEITQSHEEYVEEHEEEQNRGQDSEEGEGEGEEEPEGEYEEEPEGEGEEEPEDEAEEEPEYEGDEQPEDEGEEEPEGEGEEEPQDEGDEQPEDEGEEQPEAEAEEEPEEQPERPRSRRRRSSSQQDEPEQQRPRRRRASSGQQESEQARPRRRRSAASSRASSGGRSGGGRSSRSTR